MRPFDLKKALDGAPVVTRLGKEVTQLHAFNTNTGYPLRAVVGGNILGFTEEGAWCNSTGTHDLDLFMKTTKKQGFINIYSNKNGSREVWCKTGWTAVGSASDGTEVVSGNKIFPTEEAAANAFGASQRIAVATFEYEE